MLLIGGLKAWKEEFGPHGLHMGSSGASLGTPSTPVPRSSPSPSTNPFLKLSSASPSLPPSISPSMPLSSPHVNGLGISGTNGYSGNLEDFNPLRESESALYFHRISWEAGGAVADYVPLAHSHAVLQPTITVPSKGENAPTMHIHMAHPSHVHRIQFIRDHFKNVNGLRLFATALWLVFQSWGVWTISPSTCTLFGIQQLHVSVIHFIHPRLQDSYIYVRKTTITLNRL